MEDADSGDTTPRVSVPTAMEDEGWFMDEEMETPPVENQQRRGKGKEWVAIANLEDGPSYNVWFEEQKRSHFIVKGALKKTTQGGKRTLKCRFAGKVGYEQCPLQYYALFCSNSQKVEVFWNGEEHFHKKIEGEREPREMVMDPGATALVEECVQKSKNLPGFAKNSERLDILYQRRCS